MMYPKGLPIVMQMTKISDSIALCGRVSANTELPFKQTIHSSISPKNKTKSPTSFTTVEKV